MSALPAARKRYAATVSNALSSASTATESRSVDMPQNGLRYSFIGGSWTSQAGKAAIDISGHADHYRRMVENLAVN